MRRMAKGPVRGISIKLQEEERERRDNYVPATSAVDVEKIEVDDETRAMLKSFDMHNLPGLSAPASATASGGNAGAGQQRKGGFRGNKEGGGRPQGERQAREVRS